MALFGLGFSIGISIGAILMGCACISYYENKKGKK
jgi:hypothetical protein